MFTKIVVIRKWEFGNSLVQGIEMGTADDDWYIKPPQIQVYQISVTMLFAMDGDSMGDALVNAAYITYWGEKLSESV